MRKLLSAVLLLCASVCALGQGATVLFPAAVTQQGNFLSFATITFCSTPTTVNTLGVCQTPVSVFKDQALTQPYSSAIQTDGIGYFPPNAVTATSIWFSPAANLCYTLTTSSMISPATNPCTPFSVGVQLNGGSLSLNGNITQTQTTAATNVANQSSFLDCMNASYWTGAISATDQWCFQDVLGTGPNPTTTFTLTHGGSPGSSGAAAFSVVPPFSAAAAKNVGNVLYAAQFAVGSTTCGIAEAYAALPSSGGEIVLQNGNCSAAGWPVTIQKPLLLVGQGMGGTTDAGTNAVVAAGSWLTNTSTGNSFFIITLPAVGNSTEGVTFRDFAMFGNKAVGGATAGDCVDINGGSGASQVRALSFENVHCNQPKGSGFVIKDNAFMINFLNVHVNQSGSHCYVIKDGVNAGVNSQIHFLQSTGDLCGGSNASFNPGTADGLNISGSTSREVDIDQSTFADSNNGINVVAGAVNVNLYASHSDFETNTTCDISLNDGFGHKIMGNTLRGTGTGARGICTAMPAGAATQLIQLNIDGNNFSGHTVQDVTIGANQKTCFILPQATNIYTYTDNSGHCVRLDVNTFGILTITAAEVTPAANGATASGDSAAAWSTVFTFSNQLTEFTAPSATAGKDICYGDSTAHNMRCSMNNGSFQNFPVTIALQSAYTNATTTFSSITDGTVTMSWPILPFQKYKMSCDFTWQGSANTTGPKFQITGPAAPTVVGVNLDSAVTATTSIYASATAFSSAVANTGTITTATNFPAQLTANITNGANAGTLTVQAAANGAGTLTIASGSCQLQ